MIQSSDRWVVGHKVARSLRPELTWEVSNWQPEHRACSDRSAQEAVIEKARLEGARAAMAGDFPGQNGSGQPPLLPVYTHGRQVEPLVVREALSWSSHVQSAPDWLRPYLEVPENASPPLAMTPVHPRSVGSYGPESIAWVEENLPDVKALRWWQRLAFVRQLEHDEDGALVWRLLVESGPRRIGKSVRLRGSSLWRIAVGPSLFPEPQLVIHTGKDRQIVKEIHQKAWNWARARDGWDVRTGAGMEEVSTGDHRWLVKSTDSVYGFDTTLGQIDEAWAVSPAVFEEGLEPSTMERISPQLLLTSTAHRRATSLMRKRIANALEAEDDETLLLLWGARPQDDPGDPETWRGASPHWSEDRRKMIAAKYAKALAGEADPEADDPDPMQGFLAQYLNVHQLKTPPPVKGKPVVAEEDWAELSTAVDSSEVPASAAIEDWFAEGTSLALAYRGDRVTTISVTDHEDLAGAVTALKASGFRGVVTVGASLLEDPALKGVRTQKGQGRTGASVAELRRLLDEDAVRHDGGDHLTGQVLAARTLPSADGLRMASTGRADGIKAAVWALSRARSRVGKPRILTATNV
jgi:hypothetical protein